MRIFAALQSDKGSGSHFSAKFSIHAALRPKMPETPHQC